MSLIMPETKFVQLFLGRKLISCLTLIWQLSLDWTITLGFDKKLLQSFIINYYLPSIIKAIQGSYDFILSFFMYFLLDPFMFQQRILVNSFYLLTFLFYNLYVFFVVISILFVFYPSLLGCLFLISRFSLGIYLPLPFRN